MQPILLAQPDNSSDVRAMLARRREDRFLLFIVDEKQKLAGTTNGCVWAFLNSVCSNNPAVSSFQRF